MCVDKAKSTGDALFTKEEVMMSFVSRHTPQCRQMPRNQPATAGNSSNVQDPQTEGREDYSELTELQNLNKVGSFTVSNAQGGVFLCY